jgi:hypothetical protein
LIKDFLLSFFYVYLVSPISFLLAFVLSSSSFIPFPLIVFICFYTHLFICIFLSLFTFYFCRTFLLSVIVRRFTDAPDRLLRWYTAACTKTSVSLSLHVVTSPSRSLRLNMCLIFSVSMEACVRGQLAISWIRPWSVRVMGVGAYATHTQHQPALPNTLYTWQVNKLLGVHFPHRPPSVPSYSSCFSCFLFSLILPTFPYCISSSSTSPTLFHLVSSYPIYPLSETFTHFPSSFLALPNVAAEWLGSCSVCRRPAAVAYSLSY